VNLNLPIKIIRRDFDEPELLFNEKVQEIAEAMRRGDTIPPITVCYDGREYRLQDGFYRVAAALSLGRHMIEAEVPPLHLPIFKLSLRRWYATIEGDGDPRSPT
jgi:ParB-like chromosome segregation protein Spo0J